MLYRTAIGFLLLASLLLITSCASQSAPPPAATSAAGFAPGRYAVQWHGYIGAVEGEIIYPQFLFIDVFEESGHTPAQFNQIELVTDLGPLEVLTATISHSEPAADHQKTTLLTQLAAPEAGIYTLEAVRYIDQPGQQQQLAVGTWLLEVLPAQTADLVDQRGQTLYSSFELLNTTLVNQTTQPITIEGLHVNLPIAALNTSITTADPRPGAATSAASSSGLVLEPQQTNEYSFSFETAETIYPFISIKPFVRYHNGSSSALFPLAHHIYSTPPAAIADTLDTIPAQGYHPFTK